MADIKVQNAPPALNKDFKSTDPNNSQPAKNAQAGLQNFYNGQFTNDWKTLQASKAKAYADPSNKDAQKSYHQDELQLAADVAALHNFEKQFYVATGNNAAASKYSQADYTAEGSTGQLLQAAGADQADSKDYVYSGVSTDQTNPQNGQQVSVTFNPNGPTKALNTEGENLQATVSVNLNNNSGEVNVLGSHGTQNANEAEYSSTSTYHPTVTGTYDPNAK